MIGLSATPKCALDKMHCDTKIITVDPDVRQFETANILPYTNLFSLLPLLNPTKKGLVYIGHVSKMQEFQKEAQKSGIRAIAIWSINNSTHPMNDE